MTATKSARTTAVIVVSILAALVTAFAGVADTAQAKKKKGNKNAGQIVFASDRTSGKGVNNPEGDFEIFVMDPDGKKREQLTENTVDDFDATLSPNSQKIAFLSQNVQTSNPEGDSEVYLMNSDGSDQLNLTNNSVNERDPHFSPDGQQIAFTSFGKQDSNPEGDFEVYLMNSDGTEGRNLTNNAGLSEFASDFSTDGEKLAYSSFGVQDSNPEGDFEVYLMNVDGTEQQNLTNTAISISDFDAALSPDGQIAYVSAGIQDSNPEGDNDIYLMNADGTDQRNLSNTAGGVQDDFPDFSPNGEKLAYSSSGIQDSNREGDSDIYLTNTDGSKQKNVTKTGSDVNDVQPDLTHAKK